MPKKRSIIHTAIEHLDSKNAIGTSRFTAKQARREQGEKIWAFSTEQYHSHGTRHTYQEHILHFMNWWREQHHLLDHDAIAARADELVSQHLQNRVAEGKSAYTLASERSALRFYFANRDLTQDVTLPRREREHIIRSRTPALYDSVAWSGHFQKHFHH